MRILSIICLVLVFAVPVGAATVEESVRFVSSSPDYVELGPTDGVAVDLRYATVNNFTGQNLYGEFDSAFLHGIAAAKLRDAVARLRRINPEYQLVIFDALRPRSVQWQLWEKVVGTDQQKYVANPKGGSIHNYGFAVDISILDGAGRELDMGTPFDDFTPLAQPRYEEKFLKEGRLTEAQIANRRLLRRVMEEAGFSSLRLEWWHFNALPRAEVKANYKIIE
ncbi:MAG: M15 family metallopeptidase [Alphaproteobacteria bacterium]|nr:M15 family metallopeptidase [Alphaproteobacteria bacterium]